MKNLETEIIIDAPKGKVWNLLMKHETYSDWNPFIKSIKGAVNVGKTIKVTLQPENKKPMIFTPVVLEKRKEEEFRWLGHFIVKGIFDGEHYFKLKDLGSGKTHFTQGENFRGILTGLFLRMVGESTLNGFNAMNMALKKQVEKKSV